MLQRIFIALFFLTSLPAFAQPEDALSYCREKIRLEQEAVHTALEKHQQALDRYLAFVKKQEDSGWAGSSSQRKQQILGDIAFFRQPIEDLKKTEFTQEAGCLESVLAQRWATRVFIVNQAGYSQGRVSLQQVMSNWESDAFAELRSAVEATEKHTENSCVYVTYDRQAVAASCSSRLYVFSQSKEGRDLSKSIVRELSHLFPKGTLTEQKLSTCHGMVECYLPAEYILYQSKFRPEN